MDLEEIRIETLPATSSLTVKKFKSLGIQSYFDLINYFPSRYENYSLITPISKIQVGEIVTIQGKIIEAKNQYTRSHITIQKIAIQDDSGTIDVSWFNQPYLIRLFRLGQEISISGLVKVFGSRITLEPKEYDLSYKHVHTGRIVPIYPEKKGLSSRTIREKIFNILNTNPESEIQINEMLPDQIISFNNLIEENTAYRQIHFPDNPSMENKSIERLSFDELFDLQLANRLIKNEWEKETVGNIYQIKNDFKIKLENFIKGLPFKLTDSQKKVVAEIIKDLKKTTPMNRFLQGDVGSGKTVVAAIICYLTFLNGYQSIIMAPTEILANQHYLTISTLFKELPLKIGLQTGSSKINPRIKYNLIIGTHALLNQKFSFKKVGIVIIDEQHRFGVHQRALLKEKSMNPHLLTMTATPIPRTVALTLYGELDLSYIDEMPKGRLAIKTYLIPPEKRSDGYIWIKKQITEKNAQIFIVCPLIEESQSETLKSVKAAKIEFEILKKIFSGYKMGLLHGKIKGNEKKEIMEDFKNRKIDILVSTPVVEVGIDIPGATIMIIEGAERFGLAQLHQLRGRIGRSNQQSYCFLFTDNKNMNVISRLKYFCQNNSGAALAKYDLDHRGAGNIFGSQQHGFVNLKIASLSDYDLIEKTKNAVDYFVEHCDLKDYKFLVERMKSFEGNKISRD